MNSNVQSAVEELKKGNFVVLYDSDKREGECDLVISAQFVTPKEVTRLRKDAGGSIVLAISAEVASKLQLPYLHDIFAKAGIKNTYVRTNYGDTPPYTTPVNHSRAHTGVTDNDKALAISEFANMLKKNDMQSFFIEHFKSPGHLPICVSKELDKRRGHTELSVELARRADLLPAMVLCEMLDVGTALSVGKSREYAKQHDLVFLEGKDIL